MVTNRNMALRSIDPNARKRPKMGQVIHIFEAEESMAYFVRKVHNMGDVDPDHLTLI
jgi:hypothetical protein